MLALSYAALPSAIESSLFVGQPSSGGGLPLASMAMIQASSSSTDAKRDRRPVCKCSIRPVTFPSRASVSAPNCTMKALAYGRAGVLSVHPGTGPSGPSRAASCTMLRLAASMRPWAGGSPEGNRKFVQKARAAGRGVVRHAGFEPATPRLEGPSEDTQDEPSVDDYEP